MGLGAGEVSEFLLVPQSSEVQESVLPTEVGYEAYHLGSNPA
jgi:hypothetical protein